MRVRVLLSALFVVSSHADFPINLSESSVHLSIISIIKSTIISIDGQKDDANLLNSFGLLISYVDYKDV